MIPEHDDPNLSTGDYIALLVFILVFVAALLLPTPRGAEAAPARGVSKATWYGPGFYGNHTACGQLYHKNLPGVAVPSGGLYYLRCGAPVTVCSGKRCVRVRVIDTGGFRGYRFDLSSWTARKLCNCRKPYTMRVWYRIEKKGRA